MGIYNNDNRNILATNFRTQSTIFENFVTQEELVEGLTTKQDIIQYEILPTASIDELNNIYQYVGTTTVDYINGYFYKCVSDGEVTPTYSWVEVISGSGEVAIDDDTIKKNSLNQLTVNSERVAGVYNVRDYGVVPITYVLSEDETVNPIKTYYSFDSDSGKYRIVTNTGNKNPKEQGWYDTINGMYPDVNNDIPLNALIALVPDNSVIFFPEGEYSFNVGKLFYIKKNISFMGADKYSTTIKFYWNQESSNFPNRGGWQFMGQSKNITIRNMGFVFDTKADEKIPTGVSSLLMFRDNWDNIYIDNIYIHVGGTAYIHFASTDTSVVFGKTYYAYNTVTDTFSEVSNPTGNPSEKGWFEGNYSSKGQANINLYWLKGGANTFIFEHSLFELFTNSNAGGGLWVNTTNSSNPATDWVLYNLIVRDNEFRTTCNDEMFAFWRDPLESFQGMHEITVERNQFLHKDWNGDSYWTRHAITVGSRAVADGEESAYKLCIAKAMIANNYFEIFKEVGKVINAMYLSDGVIKNNRVVIKSVNSNSFRVGVIQSRGGSLIVTNNVFELMGENMYNNEYYIDSQDCENVEYFGNDFIINSRLRIQTEDANALKEISFLAFKANTFRFVRNQVKVLPEASSKYNNVVLQYVGETEYDEVVNPTGNPQAHGWYIDTSSYVDSTDSVVVSSKTYYTYDSTTGQYNVVTDTRNKYPNVEGWYEYVVSYSLTTDETVVVGTTYYELGFYIKGEYYKCVSDGATPPTYSWTHLTSNENTRIFFSYVDANNPNREVTLVDNVLLNASITISSLMGKRISFINNIINPSASTLVDITPTFGTLGGYFKWINNQGAWLRCCDINSTYSAPLTQFTYVGERNGLRFMKDGTYNTRTADTPTIRAKYFTTSKIVYNDLENNPVEVVETIPNASASICGRTFLYVGETTASYTFGAIYKCVTDGATSPTYSFIQVSSPSETIQVVSTLPTPSSTTLGNVYLYTGASDQSTGIGHGCIYECISDGASTPTYSWNLIGISKDVLKYILTMCNDFNDFKTYITAIP